MDYRNLGSTGLEVSPLCLGTMMFGKWGNPDHNDCIKIIHHALDEGVNFIDTANMYSNGESELIVGKALADRREKAVLTTKVYWPVDDGVGGPNRAGLSRKAIQEQVEASLRRLATDVIDLYLIHRPDPNVPWEETLSTLDSLVRQGKVRYIGCSTNHYPVGDVPVLSAWEIVDTLGLCARQGWEAFCCLQPPYSILRRTMESSHFPMTRAKGLGTMVWSPLEGGWLTGKYRFGGEAPPADPKDRARFDRWIKDLQNPKFERRSQAVEKLSSFADARGVDLAEFAIAWTLSEPAVSTTVIGPRTDEQLTSCLRALEVEVTDADRVAVDAIVLPGESVL